MPVTRTLNAFTPSVIVDASNGESLLYRVIVEGATKGIFTLVDGRTQQLLMSSKDTPHSTTPDFTFERRWPQSVDRVSTSTSHTMGFHFLGVTKYVYKVIHHRQDGQDITLMDIEYVPSSDTDSFFEDLFVTTF